MPATQILPHSRTARTDEFSQNVTGTSIFSQATPADRARLIAAARLIVRYLLSLEDTASEHEGAVDGALQAGRQDGLHD